MYSFLILREVLFKIAQLNQNKMCHVYKFEIFQPVLYTSPLATALTSIACLCSTYVFELYIADIIFINTLSTDRAGSLS